MKKLSEIISGYTIKEVDNQNRKELIYSNNDKIESVKDFISKLEQESLTIVYRGQNKNDFWNNLSRNTNKTNKFTEWEKLFMLGGGKANQYLKNKTNSKFIIDIKDKSPETIKFIFNEIAKQKNEDNTEFFDYFIKDNKYNFINLLSKSEIEIEIRDYYLYLLHTMNNSKKGNLTYFVSTSTDFKQAKYFANNGYVVCQFYPNPINRHGINNSIATEDFKNKLREKNLPIFEGERYPKQKEISIKGALFPHYMLGLFDLCNKEFILNPHFNNSEFSILDGFEIDQTNFSEMFNDNTIYIKACYRLYNGLYV